MTATSAQMDDAFGRLLRFLDEQKLTGPDAGALHQRQRPGHHQRSPARLGRPAAREEGRTSTKAASACRAWSAGRARSSPGRVSDEPVCGVDLLPTLCAATGVEPPTDRALDGVSILPLFAGQPLQRQTPLYWHFNGAQGQPKVAMRIGDWKILAQLDTPDFKPGADILAEEQQAIKKAELTSFELYNLHDDIGEKTDLAAKEPERLQAMSAQLRKLYREVRDESPTWPAWQWSRYESGRIERPNYKAKP